jgi:predicted transcriptional regulator
LYTIEKPSPISGNRTRVEILASILHVADRGTLKTHIMYKANLSHRQLEKYLTFLQNEGLLAEFVDEESGTSMYKVTERGIEFLKEYTQLSKYFSRRTTQSTQVI